MSVRLFSKGGHFIWGHPDKGLPTLIGTALSTTIFFLRCAPVKGFPLQSLVRASWKSNSKNEILTVFLNPEKLKQMDDIFEASTAQRYIARLQQLTADTNPKWGTMNASQMLAHCCVTYEMVYEPQLHRPVGGLAKWILKNFVKKKVVGEKPYPQNTPTAPQFRISGTPDFDEERKRLVGYIQKTQQLGRSAFDGKESFSFGKLTGQEWNNMFAKHLDHHLRQFGV